MKRIAIIAMATAGFATPVLASDDRPSFVVPVFAPDDRPTGPSYVVPGPASDPSPPPFAKTPPVVAAAYNWTGFYLGIEGGGGWSRDQRTYEPPNPPLGAFTNERLGGGLAGGLIGYNWQLPGNKFLLGVEGSFDWVDINGSGPCPNPAFTCAEKLNQLYSGTGRIGYVWGNALLYAKGGYAWTEVAYHATYLPDPGPFDGGGNVRRDGWVVGGGVEYMFAPCWSAKVEYDYYDFGSRTSATDSGGAHHLLTDKDSNLTAQTLKVGFNYHFGLNGPVVAKY
jgi:outer membrane immunogenic protein